MKRADKVNSSPAYLSRTKMSWKNRRAHFVEILEPRVMLSRAAAAGLGGGTSSPVDSPSVAPTFINLGPVGSLPPGQAQGDSLSFPFTPSEIRTAYGINQISFNGITGDGTGQTIAIVDAQNDPTIVSDANSFSSTFGLPAFNSGGPNLTVLSQTGTTTLPSNNTPGTWDVEEALDVEWAHAVAPEANIILFEATSSGFSDMNAAVAEAAGYAGVSVVSMSWGSPEFSGDSSMDSTYQTPVNHQGVTFIASTGDKGAIPQYPAVSPNILSVGGTSLTINNDGSYGSETAWSGGGGGLSTTESQPSYQVGKVNGLTTTARATPDVSWLADPNTGVYVLDSFDTSSYLAVGGTSLAAPMWAALVSIVDQGRTQFTLSTLDGPSQTLKAIYSLPTTDFHDITSGNNGQPATTGYDLATGLGTPIPSLLASDLARSNPNEVIVSSTPAKNSVVTGAAPTSFTVTLLNPVNSSTVQASDLTVNGIAANSVQIDATQSVLTFQFNTTPVTTQGTETISVAAGAINRSSDGAANTAYNATFKYALIPLQVSSTGPVAGSVVTLPFPTLTVNFNKAVDPSTVNVNNLTLSQGTVTGFALSNGNTTVQYTLSGVTADGTLAVTMAAGAIADTFGIPLTAYSASYVTDIVTAAFPVPLTSVLPAGSLVYTGSIAGSVGFVGDQDKYTISLDAGQSLSVVVGATAAGLQPSVQVLNPSSSVVGSATSPSAGTDAYLETLTVATAGTYTIVISAAGSTTGAYNLALTLNAAVKAASHGGSANNSLATAQNLASGAVSLGGAAQAVDVTGALSTSSSAGTIFSDNFESGLGGMVINNTVAGGLWHLSTGRGSQAGHSATHSLYFGQDEGANGGGNYDTGARTAGTVTTPTIVLPNALVSLNFNYVLQTENDPSFDLAQLQISTDGGNTFTTLVSYNAVAESSVWTPAATVNLSAYAGKSVQLRWSFDSVDQYFNDFEGWYIDDISVQQTQVALPDYYSFNLNAGDSATLALKNLTGFVPSLQMENATGTVLATGAGGVNTDQLITDFVAPATGTYYAVITGLPGESYNLLVTRNAEFGNQNNATLPNAQPVNSTSINDDQRALGSIGTAAGTTVNIYQINAIAAATLQLATSTPGGGTGEFENNFNPRLILLDSSGNQLALDDNSGSDGRNALINYVVPATKAGTLYVEVSSTTATTTSGEYVLDIVNTPPAPRVADVVVSSNAWTSSFLSYLSTLSAANVNGYSIPNGASQLATLPWTNLNQVSITFTQNVNVTQSSLQLFGVNTSNYGFSAFSYSSSTDTATWTLTGPIGTDKLLIDVNSASITNSSNEALDGEWTDGSSTYPSGNGTAGGNFLFSFNVLPGDVDQSGGVNIVDTLDTRNHQGATPGNNYSIFMDVDGSAGINILDTIAVRNRQGMTLPSGTAVAPASDSVVADTTILAQSVSTPSATSAPISAVAISTAPISTASDPRHRDRGLLSRD